jgi:hypothetical protein
LLEPFREQSSAEEQLRLSLWSKLIRARLGVLLGREGKDGDLRMQHVHNVQDALEHRIRHRRHHRHTVSGNRSRSEMVVIDLPVPAISLINTFRGPESVLKKDVTT